MLKIALSLFLSGIFLGAGPCLVSCGPFLVSFIAGNNKNFKQSLWIWFIFSLTRIFAYLILGLIVGLLSQEFLYKIYNGNITKYIFILGGAFVFLIGTLMVFNKYPEIKACEAFKKNLLNKENKSIITFGLIIGFLPCAPLLGILTYVALISTNILKAVFYCFSFGVGTLISPLIIMAFCASAISKLLISQENIYKIFKIVCGIIILFLGLRLIYVGIKF